MGTGYQSAGLKRRQFAKKMKWYIGLSGGGLFLIGVAYLVVFSGLFSVTSFELVGTSAEQKERILDVLRPQVVAGFVGGLLGSENYFSWNNSLRYEDVRSNRVSIEKSLWSRHVRIMIHPRERYGVWCLSAADGAVGCYWVDASGILFESAPTPEGQLIIAIFEPATTTAAVLGTPIMKQEHFEVVKRVAESLLVLKLPVSALMINRTLEEVQVQTISGTKVSFSLRFDPTTAALPALKKLIESPGLAGMRTVDFTVENRVFYTLK